MTENCELLEEMGPNLPDRPHTKLSGFVADWPGHDRRYEMDWTKVRDELGCHPRESFETSLNNKTVAWYLDYRRGREPIWSAIYSTARFGIGLRVAAPAG